jgi:hypothetical protein
MPRKNTPAYFAPQSATKKKKFFFQTQTSKTPFLKRMTTFIFYFNRHHEKFQLSHCFVAANVIDIFIGLVTNLLPNDLAYPTSQLTLLRCIGLTKVQGITV